MKKLVLSSGLLAFAQVGMAEDYQLDASTMAVGTTAGDNLVVKEGCFDSNQTSCSATEKMKWLASPSPAKIGSLEIVGSLTGNFEVSVTADFDFDDKGIVLSTEDNNGIGFRLEEHGSADYYYAYFEPNGMGTGGGFSFSANGWNDGYSFNKITITVQQGTARAFINGQENGKSITFGTDTVFQRVVIEGIQSYDRISEVKVRGLQNVSASCPAAPSTTDGTTPPPSGDCMASYSQNGQLHVPCVSVPDVFGGMTIYDIKLQQQPSAFTFDLDMNSVKPR